MSTSENPRPCCHLCGVRDGVYARRSLVNLRQHCETTNLALATEHWTAATLQVVGGDGLCGTCRPHAPTDGQLDLLGSR